MTKKQLRIMVIEDALRLIPKMVAEEDTFVLKSLTPFQEKNIKRGKFSPEFESLAKGCHVCGLGALFMGLLSRKFKFSPHDVCDLKSKFWKPNHTQILDSLREVFASSQLILIERAFEVSRSFSGGYLQSPNATKFTFGMTKLGFKRLERSRYKAFQFGSRYKTPKRRLTAILNNMLDNEGVFVP